MRSGRARRRSRPGCPAPSRGGDGARGLAPVHPRGDPPAMSVAGASSLSRGGVLLASAAALLVIGLVLGVSFVVTPEDVEAGRVVLSPTCHFKAIFGRECLTCGLTRAFTALSHGRLDDAWRYNRA